MANWCDCIRYNYPILKVNDVEQKLNDSHNMGWHGSILTWGGTLTRTYHIFTYSRGTVPGTGRTVLNTD